MIRRTAFFEWGRLRKRNFHELDYPEPRRARRIRDKLRMKKKGEWVARVIWSYRTPDLVSARHIGDNIVVCSCWMCGHQRKWHGPNMQEIRERARLDLALVGENYDWFDLYEECST